MSAVTGLVRPLGARRLDPGGFWPRRFPRLPPPLLSLFPFRVPGPRCLLLPTPSRQVVATGRPPGLEGSGLSSTGTCACEVKSSYPTSRRDTSPHPTRDDTGGTPPGRRVHVGTTLLSFFCPGRSPRRRIRWVYSCDHGTVGTTRRGLPTARGSGSGACTTTPFLPTRSDHARGREGCDEPGNGSVYTSGVRSRPRRSGTPTRVPGQERRHWGPPRLVDTPGPSSETPEVRL